MVLRGDALDVFLFSHILLLKKSSCTVVSTNHYKLNHYMILFATVVGWVHRFLLFQHHLLLKAFRCLRHHQRHCPCSSLLLLVWLVAVLAFAILCHFFFSQGSYCMSIICVFLLFVVGVLSFSFLLQIFGNACGKSLPSPQSCLRQTRMFLLPARPLLDGQRRLSNEEVGWVALVVALVMEEPLG